MTIQRATTVTDDFGQPGVPAWADLDAVPCWAWVATKAEVVGDGRSVVSTQLWVNLPRGTDVTERDRLRDVVDRRGTSIFPGVLNVEAVVNRRSHIELALRAAA